MNYGKSQRRPNKAISINDVRIWAYGRTMSNWVKKEYWLLSQIYHRVVWCTMDQNKITYGGNEYSWAFMELLAWLMRKKKKSIHFGKLLYEFWINHGFYNENTKFVELNSFNWVQWLI